MVGEKIAGRYELRDLVGTGGMSSVYKAYDSLLERNVALKILHEHYSDDAEFVERFRREARSVAQLSHPNIVTVIDRGEENGRQFIVFEYIDGENLKELVVRSGRLPVEDALELALQVARALAFAHEHGLVHRDVKPQNVLLNGDGRAKVTDFGIARSLEVESAVTRTGTVLGTSNYIAPEQASGQPVDVHTDVYSLGVVLYELLAGDVPFPGENFVTVALKHVNEPPPNLLEVRPDVPLRVAAAVDRALEKDPAQRFPTMDAFAAELEACLAELATTHGDGAATAIVPPRKVAGPRRRRRLLWPVLGVAVALAAAGAGAAAFLLLRDEGGGTAQGKTSAISLAAVSTYDPQGDNGEEHSDVMAKAVDGNPDTYWTTETYNTFAKDGVGLVLRAATPVRIRSVVVKSDTPGFPAEIRTGASEAGPFTTVIAPSQQVQTSTTYRLTRRAQRYVVIWITGVPAAVAHVNEVRALSR